MTADPIALDDPLFDELLAAGLPAAPAAVLEIDELPPRETVTRYEIRDATGELVAIHRRVDGPSGKRLAWLRPDGSLGLGGRPLASLPLYGIDRLTSTPIVTITEGEKAADRLRATGCQAVGTVTGAATCPGRGTLAELTGRTVLLWPDNDEAGRRHMTKVGEGLAGIAASVSIIEWPDAPEGGDAADFLDSHPRDDLVALYAATRPFVSADPIGTSGRNQVLRFRTARELASEAAAVIPWIAPPWLASGSLTELAGRAKAAGKTTLELDMVRAILDGSEFLGGRCARTKVVLLTEQPDTSFRPSLARAGLLDRNDLVVLSIADARGVAWPVVVAGCVERCQAMGAGVLIVDTLAPFAGIRGDTENDAGAALEAIEPLQDAAARGLGVMIVRHDRKAGGDVGESARGSSAFTGAVDVVLRLSRQANPVRPTVRTLAALSRFAETPDELVIELVDGRFVVLGDMAAVALAEAQSAALSVLAAGESTMAELEAAIDAKRTTIQDAIGALVASGRVSRTGAGKRGSPYRYTVSVSNISAAAPSGQRAAESNSPGPDVVEINGRLFEVDG